MAVVYQACMANINPDQDTTYWPSLLIVALWNFSKAVWRHRNQILHSVTVEEEAKNITNNYFKCI